MNRTRLNRSLCGLALAITLVSVSVGDAWARSAGGPAKTCPAYCKVWAPIGPHTDTRWNQKMFQLLRLKPGKVYWWWTSAKCGATDAFRNAEGVYWSLPEADKRGCPGYRHYYKPIKPGTHKVPFTKRTDLRQTHVTCNVDAPVDNSEVVKKTTKLESRTKKLEDRTTDLEKRPGYGFYGITMGFDYQYQLHNSVDPTFHKYGFGLRWDVYKPATWFALALNGAYSVAPSQRFIRGNPVNESVAITNHYLQFGLGAVFKPVRSPNFRLHIPIEFRIGGVIEVLHDSLVYQIDGADVIWHDGDTESRVVLSGRISLEFVVLKYWFIRASFEILGTPNGTEVGFSNPLVPEERRRFFEVNFGASTGVHF